MANITSIPAARVPFIDGRTGLISREWYRFLLNLFTITGAGSPDSIVSEYTRTHTVSTVAVSTAMTDLVGIYVVSASGVTMTLPAASTANIGKIWSVWFKTTGTCTVNTAGADVIPLPSSAIATSVVMTQRGTCLDFQCVSATSWLMK
jgi:hypothetical protein